MSMLLPRFELHEPETIEEAVALSKEFNGSSDWLAGGTDLLPNYKWGLNSKPHVISLHKIAALREATATRIGAFTRLVELERSHELKTKLPVIPATAALVASPLIRRSATVGGNLLLDNRCFYFNQSFHWRESKGFCLKADPEVPLGRRALDGETVASGLPVTTATKCLVVPNPTKCYATFSADLPAPLIAMDAEYELAGPEGVRRVPAVDFYTGDGIERNVKKPGELLTFVHIPEAAQGMRSAYEKLRLRDSWDFPELGVAASIRVADDGKLEAFKLVANALEMVPVVLDDLGASAIGSVLDDAGIKEIAKAAEGRVRPVRNTFYPPAYRKRMTRVFVERVLRGLVGS